MYLSVASTSNSTGSAALNLQPLQFCLGIIYTQYCVIMYISRIGSLLVMVTYNLFFFVFWIIPLIGSVILLFFFFPPLKCGL